MLAGLSLRAARGRGGPWTHHLASVLYLAAGLAYRFAWVGAGQTSATDDAAVARNARDPANSLERPGQASASAAHTAGSMPPAKNASCGPATNEASYVSSVMTIRPVSWM